MSLLSLLAVSVALAEDPVFVGTAAPIPEVPKAETDLSAELGFAWTTGNTMTYTLNAGVNASHKWSKNKLGVVGGINQGQSVVDGDGDGKLSDAEREVGYAPTAKRVFVDGRYDRFFGEKNSLYVLGGWLTDSFAGYDYRAHEQIGYSRALVGTDRTKLVAELGADVAEENYVEGVDPNSDVIVAARVLVGLDHKFNENVAFSDKLEVYENVLAPADLRVTNAASITASLSDRFSLKLSHALAFDNVPVEGYRTLDQTSTATFVASIL